MRHHKRGRKLGRTPAHRKALRQNLAKSLFQHERIVTTVAKAKEARSFVEKLITLARKAWAHKSTGDVADRARYLHYYRIALSRLQDKKMVQKLFGEGPWREGGSLAERFVNREGGYTRIVRLGGSRLGVGTMGRAGEIPKIDYRIGETERRVSLVGNRLGDNAPRVIFELLGTDEAERAELETAPTVARETVDEEPAEAAEPAEASEE
jgi:large subunit ribosomal protein L17